MRSKNAGEWLADGEGEHPGLDRTTSRSGLNSGVMRASLSMRVDVLAALGKGRENPAMRRKLRKGEPSGTYIYPSDLVEKLRKMWGKKLYPIEKIPTFPDDRIVRRLLEVAYHTSFMTDETRPSRFSIMYCSQRQWDNYLSNGIGKPYSSGYARLSCEFDEISMRRLCQAVDPNRVSIVIQDDNNWPRRRRQMPQIAVKGLLDTGSGWFRAGRGEAREGYKLPPFLTVIVSGPGTIGLHRSGEFLLGLMRGKIISQEGQSLADGPIPGFFNASAQALEAELRSRLGEQKFADVSLLTDSPSEQLFKCVRRILLKIGDAGHGGTLIVVPDEIQVHDPRLTQRLRVKYGCSTDRAWKTLVELIHTDADWNVLLSSLGKPSTYSSDELALQAIQLQGSLIWARTALDDSLAFIADLARVDGAVVMTDRLRVIGFGAEVVVGQSGLGSVVDQSANGYFARSVSIDDFGTRHRSAFRLCSNYEGALAFIISQDGAIRAARRVGKDLAFWPNLT
jgi:hypothetical protein